MPNKPSSKWFSDMSDKVKKNNPDYDSKTVQKTVGDIFYNKLSPSEKEKAGKDASMKTAQIEEVKSEEPKESKKKDEKLEKFIKDLKEHLKSDNFVVMDDLVLVLEDDFVEDALRFLKDNAQVEWEGEEEYENDETWQFEKNEPKEHEEKETEGEEVAEHEGSLKKSAIGLKPLAPNMTELTTGQWIVLFSYNTPVAAQNLETGEFIKTDQHHSVTTSRHINKWLAGQSARAVPQDEITHLIASNKEAVLFQDQFKSLLKDVDQDQLMNMFHKYILQHGGVNRVKEFLDSNFPEWSKEPDELMTTKKEKPEDLDKEIAETEEKLAKLE